MGAVKVMLAQRELKDREKHNSRLFVDLCENIHIHYREYRLVFSLPEYFEFIDIVSKSTADVRNYLRQNADYEEGKYKTTLMVAGGKERQMKFLENSPAPDRSHYFNNALTIELQEEYVTDEIHVHYRDLRLAMNRENFKDLATAFADAHRSLLEFEANSGYDRVYRPDREIKDWRQSTRIASSDTPVMGSVTIPIKKIKSPWHRHLIDDWSPDPQAIETLKNRIRNRARLAPLVLSREQDRKHLLIDGHHRLRAAMELGESEVEAIVTDLSWEQSAPIRRAEDSLKEFDRATDYRYGLSSFFKQFVAFSTNNYYRDHFHGLIAPPGRVFTALRGVKRLLMKSPMPAGLRNVIENVSARLSRLTGAK